MSCLLELVIPYILEPKSSRPHKNLNMNQKEILQLGIRLLGLVFLYHGLHALPTAIIQFWAAVVNASVGGIVPVLVLVAWPFAVAFWLLRGGPPIMHISYPDAPAASRNEPKAKE
jgi:hypothetical protein